MNRVGRPESSTLLVDMKLALLVVVVVVPSSARAGKYMMPDPSSTGWDWVGRAVQRGVDIGPEVGVAGVIDTDGRPDLAIDATLRWGIYRPVESWFARAGLELNATFSFPVAWDWWQVRVGIGTGVGPVALALSWVSDIIESGTAYALSPEVRIRHRGEGLKAPSFGFFARTDLFVDGYDLRANRLAIGMFGAVDVF